MLTPTASSSEIPPLFREPNVRTGFRRMHQPWLYYVCSIFQKHNECLNTWTHLVTLVIAVLKFRNICAENDVLGNEYMRPLCALFVSIMALYICSTCAHCFQNKSEIVHYTCFMVDYGGIGLYGFGSVIGHYFYSSEKAVFDAFSSLYIPIGATLGIATCVCCSISKTRYSRPYPFSRKLWQMSSVLALYVWLNLPIIHRIVQYAQTGHKTGGFHHHSEQIVWFVLAAFFFSTDIPQRFCPGKCDFIGHSHQLFHVCIAMTTIKQLDGIMADIRDLRGLIYSHPKPTFASSYGAVAIVGVANLVVMLLFRQYVKANLLTPSSDRKPCSNGVKRE